jgi:hypothetical protein
MALLASPTTEPNAYFYIILGGIAGLIGAIFSIVMQIRSRAVGPETNYKALLTDCILRLVIGVFSGCFLQLVIEAGALQITIGSLHVDNTLRGGWRAVVVIGFIAGFIERLVPSLLQERLTFERGPKANIANGNPREPSALSTSEESGHATSTSR